MAMTDAEKEAKILEIGELCSEISRTNQLLLDIFRAGGVSNPDWATLKAELQGWSDSRFLNKNANGTLNGIFEATSLLKSLGLTLKSTSGVLGATINSPIYNMITFRDKNDTIAGYFYGMYTPQGTFEIRQRAVNAKNTSSYTETALSYDGYARFEIPVIPIDATFNKAAISLGYLNNTGNNIVHKTGNESIYGVKNVFADHWNIGGTDGNSQSYKPDIRYISIPNLYGEQYIGHTVYYYQQILKNDSSTEKTTINRGGIHTEIMPNYVNLCFETSAYRKDDGSAESLVKGIKVCIQDGDISTKRTWTLINTDTLEVYSELIPGNNNVYNLGTADFRWKEIYAIQGAINTSDERLKTEIQTIPESVLRAWGKVNFQQYKMKAAVKEKGSAKARIHMGVIAQRIKEAFESEGLDATKYGLFCWNKWEESYTEETIIDEPETTKQVKVIDAQAVYDTVTKENGTEERILISPEKWHMEEEIVPAKTHMERKLSNPASEMYSVRYEECLALECAYQRWELNKIKAKLGI